MDLRDLSRIFNRSFEHVFNAQKFLSIFLILLFSGLIFLFFYGFALASSNWMKLPLLSIPFYVMSFLLMISGVDLIQAYSKEKEGQIITKAFYFSKELFLQVSYFILPLFLTSLFLWFLLGIFILLESIPYLGTFLGVVLAFVPFLIHLGILLLFLITFLVLFFYTPLLSLKKSIDKKTLITRLHVDFFTHLILLVLIFFPLWIVWIFLTKAAELTFSVDTYESLVIQVLKGLFILIPFSAFMTFPLIFFFNFSLEAYLMTTTNNRASQGNTSDFS